MERRVQWAFGLALVAFVMVVGAFLLPWGSQAAAFSVCGEDGTCNNVTIEETYMVLGYEASTGNASQDQGRQAWSSHITGMGEEDRFFGVMVLLGAAVILFGSGAMRLWAGLRSGKKADRAEWVLAAGTVALAVGGILMALTLADVTSDQAQAIQTTIASSESVTGGVTGLQWGPAPWLVVVGVVAGEVGAFLALLLARMKK